MCDDRHKPFSYRYPFIRISDSLPGEVVMKHEKANVVVVKFGNGSYGRYDCKGNPLLFHEQEHKLVNL